MNWRSSSSCFVNMRERYGRNARFPMGKIEGRDLRGAVSSCEVPGVFATYVHHLDPVLFQLGKFALRWYGLAYLGGFLGGFLLLKNLAKRGLWVLKPEQ